MGSINRVVQTDSYGCGIAVVAMAANVSYQEAKFVMFGHAKGRIVGTCYEDIKYALSIYKVPYEKKACRFRSWHGIKGTAIVLFKIRGRNEWYHWAILVVGKDGRYVIDPNPAIKIPCRTDWEKMHGVSYLLFRHKRKRIKKCEIIYPCLPTTENEASGSTTAIALTSLESSTLNPLT